MRTQQILSEAKRITSASLSACMAYFVVLTALAAILDIFNPAGSFNVILNIVDLVAVYVLIRAMMILSGLASDPLAGGFGTYFGIWLFGGTAIILGFFALIVPGIYLASRLAPAYGFGLNDGKGTVEALSAAWDGTRHSVLSITGALSLPFAALIVGLVLYIFALDDAGEVVIWLSIVGSAASNIGIIGITAVGLSVYALSGDGKTVT